MPLSPDTQLRPGDIVAILTKVSRSQALDGSVYLELPEQYSPIHVTLGSIERIYRRHYDPGDLVRLIGRDKGLHEVLAVREGYAWVSIPGHLPETVDLEQIQLVAKAGEDGVAAMPTEETV